MLRLRTVVYMCNRLHTSGVRISLLSHFWPTEFQPVKNLRNAILHGREASVSRRIKLSKHRLAELNRIAQGAIRLLATTRSEIIHTTTRDGRKIDQKSMVQCRA